MLQQLNEVQFVHVHCIKKELKSQQMRQNYEQTASLTRCIIPTNCSVCSMWLILNWTCLSRDLYLWKKERNCEGNKSKAARNVITLQQHGIVCYCCVVHGARNNQSCKSILWSNVHSAATQVRIIRNMEEYSRQSSSRPLKETDRSHGGPTFEGTGERKNIRGGWQR